MNSPDFPDWYTANAQVLMIALNQVRQALNRQISYLQNQTVEEENQPTQPIDSPNLDKPFALDQLCKHFNLSEFEREILLLCLGMELDPTWSSLCAAAQIDSQQSYPTFSLAQTLFEKPNWKAIAPESPLRRWNLIEVGAGNSLANSPLRIDERILHYLVGTHQLDKRLVGIVKLVSVTESLVESHQKLAQTITETWIKADRPFLEIEKLELPIIQLCGNERVGKRAIATQVCHRLGFALFSLSTHAIPTSLNDLHQFIELWEREAILSQAVLLLDADQTDTIDAAKENAIALIIEQISTPVIITCQDRQPPQYRPIITFDVNKPTSNEQRELWNQALGKSAENTNGFVDQLVSQFNLSSTDIQAACLQIKSLENYTINSDNLWNICRIPARPKLDELAQRIEASASWEDLVLPQTQQHILQTIAGHVRQRMTVYERWGFAKKGARGLGISALFAGASGTGKTMAAEVLAGELKLDLYKIDLSTVVSKYIGETEKNLRRVFDAAETGGVILLFDEADSLFGKRSEVKDSRDRYANLEVSYLLQRMEAYQGLAILTTNLKDSIDTAFMRRIRFVVKFPLPDVNQRAEIWRRIFPKDTPTEDLNIKKLAKLNISGGNIRNIALNAAFLAADEGKPIAMTHLLKATESEYAKLEQPLTETEIRGWV
ncbi:MAG: AAA family ATPase [Lyngbya sp.]|nr:AAA family ATPase [Lyngbya sp.]